MTVTVQEVEQRVVQALVSELPEYRFFKTHHHFRTGFDGGQKYVTVHVSSRSGGSCTMAFYWSLRHDRVAKALRELNGMPPKLTHSDVTLTFFTMNLGPNSPRWPHPSPGYWRIETPSELDLAVRGAALLVRDVGRAYLDKHEDPLAAKATLVDRNGLHSHPFPFEPVVAMDHANIADLTANEEAQLKSRFTDPQANALLDALLRNAKNLKASE